MLVSRTIKRYLYERGCPIAVEGRGMNSFIACTISGNGSVVPEVLVEAKEEVDIKGQQQLMSFAKKIGVSYALLVITSEKEKNDYYWFDVNTSLPLLQEPEFKSHSKFLERREDLKRILFRCFGMTETFTGIRTGEFDPFSSVRPIRYFQLTIVLGLLLVRAHLYSKGDMERWFDLDADGFYPLLEEAASAYSIDLSDLSAAMKDCKYSKETLYPMFDAMDGLPPVITEYKDILLNLVEKTSFFREPGSVFPTRNSIEIMKKTVDALSIKGGAIIDLASGFNFNLLSIYDHGTKSSYTGVESNKDIANIAKMTTVVCGLDRSIQVLNKKPLSKDITGKFDLVITDPPLGTFKHQDTNDKADYAELFIRKAVQLAKKGGYILAVVPESLLFSGTEKRFRSFIKDKTIVKGIISLPAHIKKPYSSVKLSILALQKKEEGVLPPEFFAGKIETLDDVDEVIHAFASWISKEV